MDGGSVSIGCLRIASFRNGSGQHQLCRWRFLGQYGIWRAPLYGDAEEARNAIAHGNSFNLIHILSAFKFDIFPARAFALGREELARAIHISGTGLSKSPVPFVTPEDILLAKLSWFRLGNEVSEVQWRDIKGIVRGRAASLDREYLERNAQKLAVSDLLARALNEL